MAVQALTSSDQQWVAGVWEWETVSGKFLWDIQCTFKYAAFDIKLTYKYNHLFHHRCSITPDKKFVAGQSSKLGAIDSLIHHLEPLVHTICRHKQTLHRFQATSMTSVTLNVVHQLYKSVHVRSQKGYQSKRDIKKQHYTYMLLRNSKL